MPFYLCLEEFLSCALIISYSLESSHGDFVTDLVPSPKVSFETTSNNKYKISKIVSKYQVEFHTFSEKKENIQLLTGKSFPCTGRLSKDRILTGSQEVFPALDINQVGFISFSRLDQKSEIQTRKGELQTRQCYLGQSSGMFLSLIYFAFITVYKGSPSKPFQLFLPKSTPFSILHLTFTA